MGDKTIYSEDTNKAGEFLRLTIPLLSKHQISANPHNYQIGYEYVSGKNLSLINDFDKLLEQPKSPAETQLNSLYQQHFLQDEASLVAMRQEIQRIIASISKDFQNSGDKFSSYTQTLNQFVDILDNENSPNKILEKTQRVIKETNSLEKSHQNLELKINDLVADIESLRTELEQVKEESKTDALTGIANRKAFDAALEHSILTSRETNKSFCLLLLDIDHFKVFNDTYGHLIGDKVLRFVAASLKRNIKGNDFVARFGGEEFTIILPATNIGGAMTVAEQVREAISSGKLTGKGANTSYGKIAISIGVAQFQASDLSNELIERADKALYLAKDNGRNRVEKL